VAVKSVDHLISTIYHKAENLSQFRPKHTKMVELFSIPMFFILFRETLEAAIIVSILLSFIDRIDLPSLEQVDVEKVRSKFKKMVWIGTAIGLIVTLIVGGTVISIFYISGRNLWDGAAEYLWEAVFGFIACIFITLTAISMLKSHDLTEKLQAKLQRKIEESADDSISPSERESILPPGGETSTIYSGSSEELIESKLNKLGSGASHAFFWIPFLTVLREGVETLLFVGGVAISEPPSSIPLAALFGLILGLAVGAFIHYGGSKLTLHWFFVICSYVLLLIAAGLLSKSEGLLEDYAWSFQVAVDPERSGAQFFDPRKNIWSLPCCKRSNGAWGVFSALLGWRDVATIGTVVIYICYWVVVTVGLVLMRYYKLKVQ
jgi:high-affinity iron transporter